MGDSSSSREHKSVLDDDGITATIETDVLVVGTGPAGASLAAFLASHGVRGLVIGATSSTAKTPRAHYTNMAAIECLRDIGLEEECIKAGTPGEHYLYWRWCHSLAGEEYARAYGFGNDPIRKVGIAIRLPQVPSRFSKISSPDRATTN